MTQMQGNSRPNTSFSGWQRDSIMKPVTAKGLETLTLYLMMTSKIRDMKMQLAVLKAKAHLSVRPWGPRTEIQHLTKTKVLQMPEISMIMKARSCREWASCQAAATTAESTAAAKTNSYTLGKQKNTLQAFLGMTEAPTHQWIRIQRP